MTIADEFFLEGCLTEALRVPSLVKKLVELVWFIDELNSDFLRKTVVAIAVLRAGFTSKSKKQALFQPTMRHAQARLPALVRLERRRIKTTSRTRSSFPSIGIVEAVRNGPQIAGRSRQQRSGKEVRG